jgi:hypothetical protein
MLSVDLCAVAQCEPPPICETVPGLMVYEVLFSMLVFKRVVVDGQAVR